MNPFDALRQLRKCDVCGVPAPSGLCRECEIDKLVIASGIDLAVVVERAAAAAKRSLGYVD